MTTTDTRIAMIGACRYPVTLGDAAREMHILERDVRELLAILEAECERLGIKKLPSESMVPLVDCGGYTWMDLHAFEQALGFVMDPQTPVEEWATVAKVYHGSTRALLEERLHAAAKGIFQPLRATTQNRARQRRFEERHRPRGPYAPRAPKR